VPGEEPGVNFAQEVGRLCACLLILAPGYFPYAQRGDGMHRRLAQATGVRWGWRRVRGGCGARPVIGTRIITLRWSFGIEDDVRNFTGHPLMSE
jgi:hypothetical protein